MPPDGLISHPGSHGCGGCGGDHPLSDPYRVLSFCAPASREEEDVAGQYETFQPHWVSSYAGNGVFGAFVGGSFFVCHFGTAGAGFVTCEELLASGPVADCPFSGLR